MTNELYTRMVSQTVYLITLKMFLFFISHFIKV